MISEFFLNIVFNVVSGFFDLLPEFEWSVDTSAIDYMISIFKFAGYMFPWHTLIAIVSLIIGFSIFRIVIAFIKSIWDLLPFA